MNKEENIGVKILDIFTQKQNYDAKINNTLYSFLNSADQLVKLSDDMYQIEASIELNKISLKDYVLNSEPCLFLKENNIKDYSIDYLKNFFNNFKNQNNVDIFSYELALSLYEKLEEIEEIEDNKITYELDNLNDILNINQIQNIDKNQYQNLYNSLLLEVKEKYVDTNVIDEKIYNSVVQILNDIFNYYLYGHISIKEI